MLNCGNVLFCSDKEKGKEGRKGGKEGGRKERNLKVMLMSQLENTLYFIMYQPSICARENVVT